MNEQNRVQTHLDNPPGRKISYRDCASDAEKKDALIFAKATMVHALNVPHLSLCVLTRSLVHAERIWSLLMGFREENPDVEEFFGRDGKNRFFIDTVDAVGIDARDVIFCSDF
jgi:hypothetical protein